MIIKYTDTGAKHAATTRPGMNMWWRVASLVTLISLAIPLYTRADDTDIYINPSTGAFDKPMVMLSLDYRPSLGNSFCSDDEDVTADGPCGQLVEEGFLKTDAIRVNGKYSSLEIYRAVLKKVMVHDLGDGVKIRDVALFGIMVNHENINNCDGPNETDCSNGGFILSKFRDLSVAANDTFFFNALESIQKSSFRN